MNLNENIEGHYEPQKSTPKWAAVVPLVGGMAIGNYMATGRKPEFMLSFPAFMGNDQHIRNYWPDVPYSLIDPETEKLFSDVVQEERGCYKCHKENLQKKFEDIDFVSSVPPCAGLSMMNSSSKKGSKAARGADAVQNEWMYKSSRFVLENIQPKVLFGENAPGLYTKSGQKVVDNLIEIGKEFGYSFSLYKTNSIYHGIPQKRERTFYFFWKDDNAPYLDWYRREYKELAEYLKEIPKNASMQDWSVSYKDFEKNAYYKFLEYKYGKDNWRNEIKDYKTFTHLLASRKLVDEAIEFLEKHDDKKATKFVKHVKKKMAMGKGWWDNSPHFFTTEINALIGRTMITTVHPTQNRGLNLRECAHIMGLPHDFNLKNEKQYNHLAQNVPTCTAKDMTYEVLKFIDGKHKPSSRKFIKQTNSSKIDQTPKKSKQLF